MYPCNGQHCGTDLTGLQTGYPDSTGPRGSELNPGGHTLALVPNSAPIPGDTAPVQGIPVHLYAAAPRYHAPPVAPEFPTVPIHFPQPCLQEPAVAVTINQYQETPTIKQTAFDVVSDAHILRKAMKGLGTDEAAIINVLAKRTNEQRQHIAQCFKSTYNRNLIKDLKSELSGRFEDTILAMMTPKWEFLAMKLNKAISGIGTREKTLVDILCTGTNEEIRGIKAAYQKTFNNSLESNIAVDTSGHFKKLLLSLCKAERSEDQSGDASLATNDAQALYQAGEKKVGTNESTFNMILSRRSFPQILLMLNEYERITGHLFEKAIENEFSGKIKAALLAIVKSARNRAAYFAERLHESIAGLGTNDEDLIFILVIRAEIDMENIKEEYNKIYDRSLAQDIFGDTSGDYRKVLLTLIGM